MATFNMDNYAAITDSEVKVGPSKQNARVKCIIDEYTLGAELAINDELLLNKIPESAILVDAYVWINYSFSNMSTDWGSVPISIVFSILPAF